MSDNWYETFFDGVVVDMWLDAVPAERTAAEVRFLEEALAPGAGARVLDIACGQGRHAVELARRGYDVTAIDISEAMLGHARLAAAEADVDVDWQRSDMRDLPDGSFDAAYCMGNSFGYLGPDGNRDFLERVATTLAPGALFVLHTGMVAECVLPDLAERGWAPIGDLLFLEENRYLAEESCLETIYTFVRDGEEESRTARHWVYTVRELTDLHRTAGLEVRGLFSAPDCSAFELGSTELLLVARRA